MWLYKAMTSTFSPRPSSSSINVISAFVPPSDGKTRTSPHFIKMFRGKAVRYRDTRFNQPPATRQSV
ncbi:hypothetical protein O3P69_007361 [Scylla paramamosain]|uniref:Uncharacterized protein n=1 Tax=Scylla paramamosain TaxID=85552 RepID=A0AAW0V739_SCYPA